jgi:hypothetical protein
MVTITQLSPNRLPTAVEAGEKGLMLNEGIIHWHASGMNNGFASD